MVRGAAALPAGACVSTWAYGVVVHAPLLAAGRYVKVAEKGRYRPKSSVVIPASGLPQVRRRLQEQHPREASLRLGGSAAAAAGTGMGASSAGRASPLHSRRRREGVVGSRTGIGVGVRLLRKGWAGLEAALEACRTGWVTTAALLPARINAHGRPGGRQGAALLRLLVKQSQPWLCPCRSSACCATT